MSLDVSKLEKARELADGGWQARCPACAEEGGDRKGEHLRIYPDGRFGCCVHPQDREHRRRIFALAGNRKPGSFSVKIYTAPTPTAARSVREALTIAHAGTFGTGKTESESGVPAVPTFPAGDFGTLGTGHFKSRAYARGELSIGAVDVLEKRKESERPVPSVPRSLQTASVPPLVAVERLPYLAADGTLVIPFDSPSRFHWWNGGQSVTATLAEVRAGFTY
jgi:hypothetical protein